MLRIHRRLRTVLLVPAVSLFLLGCPQEIPHVGSSGDAPEGYSVAPTGIEVEIDRFDVTGFLPPPAEAEEGDVATEEAAVAAEMAEEEVAEGEGEGSEEGPRTAQILFDLLVRFSGPDPAPESIEVRIAHRDAAEEEKGTYQETLVTHEMAVGEERHEALEFEVANFRDEDGFAVEVVGWAPAPVD